MKPWIISTAVIGILLSRTPSAWAAAPIRVVPEGALTNVRQPQAAVDERGIVYIAYGAGNAIYCSVSVDGGWHYGQPVKVGEVGALSLGMRRGPRVAVNAGGVVITAVGGEVGRGRDGDILAWRSQDQGATWEGPARVNDVQAAAREGLHAMAAGPDGQIYCLWLDLRHKKTEIFGSASTDGGATWSRNQLVYRSPSGSVCECCHPFVAFDRQGRLYAMWRNSIGGNRDLYVSVSNDGGRRYGSARKLGRGAWKLDACPMDGGALALTPSGQPLTVWRRDRQVFRAELDGDEQLVDAGEQPWVAAGRSGAYLVWLSRRPGDLWLSSPREGKPIKLAAAAIDPVVAASLEGRGPVVVVWESGASGSATIMSALVADDRQ